MSMIAIFILVFLGIRTLVSFVNLFSSVHLREEGKLDFPFISVLIPARNEESNIGNILLDLAKADYPNYEVIVCNDHSEDRTTEVLDNLASQCSNINWFNSGPLPVGWTGKNFACWQLGNRASGDYFLFLDADVRIQSFFLKRIVSYSKKRDLTLVSVFPKLIMKTFGEKITSPVMHWVLVSLLPLPLVSISKRKSLAAAAGGCMLFKASAYRSGQWHLKVSENNVEDISIARLVKANGLKMATLLGDDDFSARMYSGFRRSVEGFSKNVHAYFGGKRLAMILFWILIISGPFFVFSTFQTTGIFVFLGLVILNRLAISAISRQNLLMNLVLHPVQMVSFTLIVFRNIAMRFNRKAEWRGRFIKF